MHLTKPTPRHWRTGLAGLLAAVALGAFAQNASYVQVPGGPLDSVLANDADKGPVVMDGFAMRATPVTKGEYRAFVAANPQWQRGRIARTFADNGYLKDWPEALPRADWPANRQPVVNVSWFAAQAFCEAEGARLPTWQEWEYAAAADATRRDARADPAWRARILNWYAKPASASAADVGGEANVYGVRDLHGLIWEWVDDFNALLVSPDSRSNDDPDKLQFCGAGAISLQQRENYAVLMRIALLSSLGAADSTSSLGFRCVRPQPTQDKP
jgi:formylglycine-generating enzyme required for sulfatase activity